MTRKEHSNWLEIDSFLVPTYWVVLVGLSVLLGFREREREWSWCAQSLWVGAATVAAATVTAIADVHETGRLWAVLETPIDKTTDALLRGVLNAALFKWGASALTVALLTGLFYRGRPLHDG